MVKSKAGVDIDYTQGLKSLAKFVIHLARPPAHGESSITPEFPALSSHNS